MKRFLNIALLLALLLAGCAPAVTPTQTEAPATEAPTSTPVPPTVTVEPRTLNVFAAASLTDAFTEINEYGAAILLSENLEGITQTMPMAIYPGS